MGRAVTIKRRLWRRHGVLRNRRGFWICSAGVDRFWPGARAAEGVELVLTTKDPNDTETVRFDVSGCVLTGDDGDRVDLMPKPAQLVASAGADTVWVTCYFLEASRG